MVLKKYIILASLICCSSHILFCARPPGLNNFGATCYVNATLQNLYNTVPLRNYLLTQNIAYPANSFSASFVQLMKEMNKGRDLGQNNQSLYTFIHDHAYKVMGGCGHQDAHEFVSRILNFLMEEDPRFQGAQYRDPNRLKRDHPIGKILNYGQASIVACPSINFERTRVDYELFISPEVGNLTTVKACLQNFFKTEQLNDPNNYYRLDLSDAEKTQRQDLLKHNRKEIPNCNRRIAINHLNEIVIIALKRFEQDPFSGQLKKLEQNITVEEVVNFGPYMAKPTTNAPNYRLIGAIVQMGELRAGHYIAYVRSNNTWYYCNDSRVQEVDWNQMEIMGENGRESIHQSYMLFYQRIGATQPVITPPQPTNGQRQQQEALRLEQERLKQAEEKRKRELEAKAKRELEEAKKRQQEKVRLEQEARLKQIQEENAQRAQAEKLQREQEEAARRAQADQQKDKLAKALRNLQVTLDGLQARLL
ncbi:MAG: hypothetical protein AB7F19_04490 [Candidatus Babeliales bacterium]